MLKLGGNIAKLDDLRLISANSEKVKIKHHFYQPIYLGDFTERLIERINYKEAATLDIKPSFFSLSHPFGSQPEAKLTNIHSYKRINHFLEDDAILATMDLLMRERAHSIG